MTQQHFTPAAELRQRGSRILLIALAALFLAAASVASLSAQSPSGSPTPGAAGQPASGPAAPAQTDQNGAPSDVGTPTIRTTVNEVSLIFTVNDRHGHYIPNLKLTDFALLDDQKAPAKVNSFHQQINLPLRVGIVIDASSSIKSRFKFEQQSATEFLLQVLQGEERPRLRHGIRCDAHSHRGLDQRPGRSGDGHQQAEPRRRHGALRRRVYRLPRQAADRARAGAGAQGHHPDLRRRTTTRAACTCPKPSRSASAPRPSSTPSAPTGRPAAATATRCCSNWRRKPAARSSSLPRWKIWR